PLAVAEPAPLAESVAAASADQSSPAADHRPVASSDVAAGTDLGARILAEDEPQTEPERDQEAERCRTAGSRALGGLEAQASLRSLRTPTSSGSVATIEVPCPGPERTMSDPFASSVRSRIDARPTRPARRKSRAWFASNPRPSSVTS